MVVHADPKDQSGFCDSPRRLGVALARLVIARRMIVDEDDSGGADLKRALDDLARIGRRLADRAFPEQVVGHQLILRGQEEDPEALVDQIGHVGLQIVEQLAGGRDDLAIGELQAQAVKQRRLDIPQKACRLGADAARAIVRADGQRGRQRAEFGDQRGGPGGGFGRPGPPKECVQEGSAPFARNRR